MRGRKATFLNKKVVYALLAAVVCVPTARAQAPISNEPAIVWSPHAGPSYGLQEFPRPDPSNEVGVNEVREKAPPPLSRDVLICEPASSVLPNASLSK
jgi:hypothetical protein